MQMNNEILKKRKKIIKITGFLFIAALFAAIITNVWLLKNEAEKCSEQRLAETYKYYQYSIDINKCLFTNNPKEVQVISIIKN